MAGAGRRRKSAFLQTRDPPHAPRYRSATCLIYADAVMDSHTASSIEHPPCVVANLHTTRVLSLDAGGRILDWISWQDAACLYVREAVAWTLGEPCLTLHGGFRHDSGDQSVLRLHPIVASRGRCHTDTADPSPALSNAALFARDRYLCLYCGRRCTRGELTRDHVVPLSRGGLDIWENVVSACLACNLKKGSRLPQQAGMPLLAVPYKPSWVEHLILSNRNILADQMEFLVHHLPRRRRSAA
jgi:5-methylcytosine-specific restriction endonuclease McrA